MKKKLFSAVSMALLLLIVSVSCRKSVIAPEQNIPADTTSKTQPNFHPPYPQTYVRGCSYSPNYGDSIIYPQPTTGPDYIVSPVNNPGQGIYFSWPNGLVIDSATGAINVTQSETGMRFDIGFVKTGTTDTCLTTIIIAGASYMDDVYVLGDNQTKANPYFNANPSLTTAPSGSKFDLNKNAYNQKISVNNGTGVIDLNNTLNGGGFGPVPFDGQTIQTDMYYSLNDLSNKAVQHIIVQLMYYKYKSQISPAILNTILLRKNNILASSLITTNGNARPPIIIITRFD